MTSVVETARRLLALGGALESTAGGGERIASSDVARAIEKEIRGQMPADHAGMMAADVVATAERALSRVGGGAPPSTLSDAESASLEAIVLVVGRPAMHYVNGRVQMPASDLGENDRWRVLVATARSKIDRAAASVGRITLERPGAAPEGLGTGWRLGDDLVVTNRHVAKRFVTDATAPCTSWRLDATKCALIDFAATHEASAPATFVLDALLYCAEEHTVDVAVLRAAPGTAPLPAPLKVDVSAQALGRMVPGAEGETFKGGDVYVVGHPERGPSSSAIRSVFGRADGRKRWSPGEITRIDSSHPLLEHDCSTLGGNSGSCMLGASSHAVVAVHYGAVGFDEVTARGEANRATALARLGTHRAARIFTEGRV